MTAVLNRWRGKPGRVLLSGHEATGRVRGWSEGALLIDLEGPAQPGTSAGIVEFVGHSGPATLRFSGWGLVEQGVVSLQRLGGLLVGNVRQHHRTDMFGVTLLARLGAQPVPLEVRDLSIGGAGVLLPIGFRPPPPGHRFSARLLAPERAPVEASLELRTHRPGPGGATHLGLRFLEPDRVLKRAVLDVLWTSRFPSRPRGPLPPLPGQPREHGLAAR